MQTRARKARVLYILGDLFEVWLGDDDPAPGFQPIFAALKNFSTTAQLFFMHGNRDFLIGKELTQSLGCRLLEEPTMMQLGALHVALMHGDLLCTDDVDYQNFRQLVRDPDWQRVFLSKPLAERRSIAAGLREKSSQAMVEKQQDIMDVNQQTVAQTLQELKADILIHGHTHRPGIHHLNDHKIRYVLGDWRPEPSYLSWHDNRFQLIDPRIQATH